MKFRNICLLLFSLVIATSSALGQQSKPKRPVKNPPQYPNIIDLDDKDQKSTQPERAQQDNKQTSDVTINPDALTKAFTIIADELKSLSQEVKAMNLRQQIQLELLRMSRIEQRIATYESELRPIRERIAALEAEEQTLQQMLSRDSLIAQTANMASINREATINQLRYQHEIRLQTIRAEKDRLKALEASQAESLSIYQKMSDGIDKQIQQAEERLRQLENSKTEGGQTNSNQEKP
ncbi:MAG: hypothetical protein AB7P14_11695 [Blastocatellales bacterium]